MEIRLEDKCTLFAPSESHAHVHLQMVHQRSRYQIIIASLYSKHIWIINSYIMNSQEQTNKNYGSFIGKEHPYYDLLNPVMNGLHGIFNLSVDPQPKVPETEYGLKIYITQSQDQKLNSFVYTFRLPISIQKYEQMRDDIQLQKKLDSNIAKYEIIKQIDQSTQIFYLSYKKVLLITARDFIYARYCFNAQNEHWSVSTSLPQQDEAPGLIRGKIIRSATRATSVEGGVQIWTYSQIDMKMQMKPESTKPKGVLQIKRFVQKWYECIKASQKNGEISKQ